MLSTARWPAWSGRLGARFLYRPKGGGVRGLGCGLCVDLAICPSAGQARRLGNGPNFGVVCGPGGARRRSFERVFVVFHLVFLTTEMGAVIGRKGGQD